MYIYLITNLINNKKYVGQTNNFQRRMNEHRSGQGTVIDQAIKAYGVKNFSWEIIWESDNQNEINQKEQEFIIYYNKRQIHKVSIHLFLNLKENNLIFLK